MKNKVILIGPLPPPVYGLSTTNDAVREHLERFGADVVCIDTSRDDMSMTIYARLSRVKRVLLGFLMLSSIKVTPGCTLYMSVSGGAGKIYEIIFILLAKIKGIRRIYLRHASYAYLSKRSFLNQVLVSVSGSSACHVTQCKQMSSRLLELYGVSMSIPISNVVLYSDWINDNRIRQSVRVVGFMSNISLEKGVIEFLELMEKIQSERLPIKGILAGPYQDQSVADIVGSRLQSLDIVEYVGPLYGARKKEFFAQIDVFIFPTKYINETEAKVNLEALSNGVPVIAFGRGCIPEILDSMCCEVVNLDQPFVDSAFDKISMWFCNQDQYYLASRSAAEKFKKLYIENSARWHSILAEISGSSARET